MSNYSKEAKKEMAKIRAEMDMTPISVTEALEMPPNIVAQMDEYDASHKVMLDIIIEAARLDVEKTPDMTGLVYGSYLAHLLADVRSVMGIMGEAILRLAKLPDLEDETETRFEEIINGE